MALRWAIVGAGDIAEKCVAGAIVTAPNSTLDMAMRRDEVKLGDFAERWNVPKRATRLEEVLANPDIDAVYVATPVHLHREQTVLAAQAGKHVLVEKPMAMSSTDCEEMMRACTDSGVKLGIAFYQRFNARHQKMREWIAAGRIGQIVGARIQFGEYYPDTEGAWRQIPSLGGGGTIMDTGSHCVDTLRALLGAEVRQVTGFVDTLVFSYAVDDTASFLLRFDNGAHAIVTSFWTTPGAEQEGLNIVEVYGTEGRMVAAPINAKNSEGTLRLTRTNESIEYTGDQNTHVAMLEDFVQAVDEDRDPQVAGRDGLLNMRVLEAAVRSSGTGQAVPVDLA